MYKFSNEKSIVINQPRYERGTAIYHFFDLNMKKQGDLVFPVGETSGLIRDAKGREVHVGVGKAASVEDMKCAIRAYTVFCA